MKKIFLFLFITSISVYSKAQIAKDYTFSGGIEMAYAVGNFHSNHTLGFGLSAQSEYLFSDNASLTMNAAYISFATKSVYDTVPAGIVERKLPAFSCIPVVVGMKIYNDKNFYVQPEVGIVFRLSGTDPISAAYGLAVGVIKSRHTDFSIRYQAVHKKGTVASFFALRTAYVF